jgi:hypothetical protein
MCLSPDAWVALKVYTRLVERGVDPKRAEGVARKVQARYAQSRRETANHLLSTGHRLQQE